MLVIGQKLELKYQRKRVLLASVSEQLVTEKSELTTSVSLFSF